jgi:hypothetical protein
MPEFELSSLQVETLKFIKAHCGGIDFDSPTAQQVDSVHTLLDRGFVSHVEGVLRITCTGRDALDIVSLRAARARLGE